MRTARVLGIVVSLLALSAVPSYAGPGGTLARSALRSASRQVALRRAMVRDLWNHRISLPRRVPRPQAVFRYTSRSTAAREARTGVPAYRHMTAQAKPGRPLSGSRAARTFGLPRVPTARETIKLPAGQPVIRNKAQGGSRGVGELVSPRAIAPNRIVRVVPLRTLRAATPK